jgi:hypothetical protein
MELVDDASDHDHDTDDGDKKEEQVDEQDSKAELESNDGEEKQAEVVVRASSRRRTPTGMIQSVLVFVFFICLTCDETQPRLLATKLKKRTKELNRWPRSG